MFSAASLRTDPNFNWALRFGLKARVLPTQIIKKKEVKEASFEKINRAIKHSFRLASQRINHCTNTTILSCWQTGGCSVQPYGKYAAWSGRQTDFSLSRKMLLFTFLQDLFVFKSHMIPERCQVRFASGPSTLSCVPWEFLATSQPIPSYQQDDLFKRSSQPPSFHFPTGWAAVITGTLQCTEQAAEAAPSQHSGGKLSSSPPLPASPWPF